MDPYLGEIRAFAGNFAPVGWAACNGALLPISQYDALYTLIGTTYGGDGISTFAVPDLRGRTPVQNGQLPGGSSYPLGGSAGVESVTLTSSSMPSHQHGFNVATTPGTTNSATNNFLSTVQDTGNPGSTVLAYIPYSQGDTTLQAIPLNPRTIGAGGGSQPHENRQPFLAITYIIATQGVYPSFQ
ncbi:MAG: tail fiber protein [Chitinophagaceae bacterium]